MTCRFTNPLPLGIRVPQWALIDVTVRCYVFFNGKGIHSTSQSENIWDLNKAYAVGGEYAVPQAIFIINV